MKKLFLSSLAALFCWTAMAQSPLTLDAQACREMALAHNEDLMRAGNEARKAELDKRNWTNKSLSGAIFRNWTEQLRALI